MLKFIRKYQLFFLAIGGSLLMVIFLLEPIIGNFAPDPSKREVATVGPGNTTVTSREMLNASFDVEAFERVLGNPVIENQFGGDADTASEHWFLLRREAEQAGLVGAPSDGRFLLRQNAQQIAQQIIQQEATQRFQAGQPLPTPEEQQQRTDEIVGTFLGRAEQFAASNRLPVERAYEAFAALGGVTRMVRLYQTAPRYSDRRAAEIVASEGSSLLADFLFVRVTDLPEPTGGFPAPTDDELWDHVQRFGDVDSGASTDESPLGIGYRQPPRVKLEYLRLDAEGIRAAVEVDPIEVRKQWQRENPGAASSAFAAERESFERAVRLEEGSEIIDAADQIVRSELLKYTRGLEDQGAYKALPDDWRSELPDLEQIAAQVVAGVQERAGVTIPTPQVIRRTDRWLRPADISRLEGFGRAAFRLGAQSIPTRDIARFVREGGAEESLFTPQVGVPLVNPFATDTFGNRYYTTVLDAIGAAPPTELSEVRTEALQGYDTERRFERLTERVGLFEEIAGNNG
ncbi:MAG: hypothetical protein AAF235_06070, partial [Planctomycetota bacterium]